MWSALSELNRAGPSLEPNHAALEREIAWADSTSNELHPSPDLSFALVNRAGGLLVATVCTMSIEAARHGSILRFPDA